MHADHVQDALHARATLTCVRWLPRPTISADLYIFDGAYLYSMRACMRPSVCACADAFVSAFARTHAVCVEGLHACGCVNVRECVVRVRARARACAERVCESVCMSVHVEGREGPLERAFTSSRARFDGHAKLQRW